MGAIMRLNKAIAILAVVFPFLFPVVSLGAEYQSAKGFRFEYPDGWIQASASDQQAVKDQTAKLLGRTIDFSIVEVMIYNPGTKPTQNVNVIVTQGESPLDEQGRARAESALKDQFSRAGIYPAGFESHLIRMGNYDAISSTWSAKYGQTDMQQWQVTFSGGGRTYIFTCSAGPHDFAILLPAFNQIINSVQFSNEAITPQRSYAALFRIASEVGSIGFLAVVVVILALVFGRGKRISNTTSPITGQQWNNE
jgi:hypothetical protein